MEEEERDEGEGESPRAAARGAQYFGSIFSPLDSLWVPHVSTV